MALGGSSFRLALIQLGHTSATKATNLERAKSKILEAVQSKPKPDLIVLPECFNSPYGVQYFQEYAEDVSFSPGHPFVPDKSKSETVRLLSSLAKEYGTWIVGGSIPELDAATSKLYNTSYVFSRKGEVVARHRKVHLFDIDIPGGITFKESETLSPGSDITLFETEVGTFGLGICYDMRFPELATIAARKGAVGMIYPGAFNTTTGPLHWELLQRARAVDNQFYVVSCSPARPLVSGGYPSYGFSMVVDPSGKVIESAEEEETTVFASIDIDGVKKARQQIPVTKQRRFDVYPDVSKGL